MATWPALTTPSQLGGTSALQKLVDGYVPTAADLNGAHGAQRWWQGGDSTADGCRPSWSIFTKSSFPSIPSGTSYNALSYVANTLSINAFTANTLSSGGGEGFDTQGLNQYSWVVGPPGLYLVEAQVSWPSNTTGSRMLSIEQNSTIIANSFRDFLSSQDQFGRVTNSILVSCLAGDVLTPLVWQNSGSALTPTCIQFSGTLVSF